MSEKTGSSCCGPGTMNKLTSFFCGSLPTFISIGMIVIALLSWNEAYPILKAQQESNLQTIIGSSNGLKALGIDSKVLCLSCEAQRDLPKWTLITYISFLLGPFIMLCSSAFSLMCGLFASEEDKAAAGPLGCATVLCGLISMTLLFVPAALFAITMYFLLDMLTGGVYRIDSVAGSPVHCSGVLTGSLIFFGSISAISAVILFVTACFSSCFMGITCCFFGKDELEDDIEKVAPDFIKKAAQEDYAIEQEAVEKDTIEPDACQLHTFEQDTSHQEAKVQDTDPKNGMKDDINVKKTSQ